MYDKILFIQTHGIGDVITCLPSLQILKEKMPKAKICILVQSNLHASIFKNFNLVDEVFIYRGNNFFHLFNLLWTLRKKKFKAGIVGYFVNAKLASILFKIIGINYSVGYTKNLNSRLFTYPLVEEPGHKIHKNIRLLKGIGINELSKCNPHPNWIISNHEYAWEHNFCANLGLKEETIIGLTPGGNPAEIHKKWPIKNFKLLSNQILEKIKNAKILILGNLKEQESCESIARSSGNRVINLAGKLTLHQTATIIKRSTVIIGSDNGLLHIAASLGVPIIALFGPTDFNLTGPYSDSVRMISLDLDCSPCYPSLLKGCGNPICMTKLSPELVMKELLNYLKLLTKKIEDKINK